MSDAVQPFEAEVSRVLELVINSLYTHREIFLRELVSNASDACDRLRYQSLGQPELLSGDSDLKIVLTVDTETGTLTITDNGIGMNHDEMADNLGTIARSGSARFIDALSGDKSKDVSLIGQFGVGFYSAFMVADKVAVISRKAGETGTWRWESDGRSGYTLSETAADHPRGTSVVLELKDDAKEFFEEHRLRHVVRTYSDHIAVPILLDMRVKDAETSEDEDGKEQEPREPQQINAASALWTRPKSEISEEQYKEFYHHVAHAFDDPWARVHFQVEGMLSYTALLYLPGSKPFDLYDPKRRHGVKLYVKRVFITDEIDNLLPRYLRFVAGVVDSEDLQLNVSRETMQNSAIIARMKKALVKRLIDEIERCSVPKAVEDGEDDAPAAPDYTTFWENFGPVFKEGIYEDHENRERLLKLARFRSTQGDGWVSLDDYLGRMKEGQDAIFAITGESVQALRSSPQLEACRARGIEVLLLDDPVDEFWLGQVDSYQDKPFRSLTKGEIDLSGVKGIEDEETEAKADEQVETGDLDRLIAALKLTLGDAVKEVRASKRLTESAVCLVAEDQGMDLRLERFLKEHNQLDALSQRVLEINPKHALIRRLAAMAKDDSSGHDLGEMAHLLLDQARIVEGEPIPDPGAFSRRMSAYLARGLAS